MTMSLLGLTRKPSANIEWLSVMRGDIIPWVLSGAMMTLIYVAIVYIVVAASHDSVTFTEAAVNLPSYSFLTLAILGCVLARRSKGAWTWILAAVLFLFFTKSTHMTFAAYLLPNGILPMMFAMLGLLAVGRIVEYLHMRYVIELDEPRLTTGGWVSYLLLVVVAIVMNSALIFDLFSNNLLLRL